MQDAARYLQSRELPEGGFAEPGGRAPSPGLSAWAALGLWAAAERPRPQTVQYLLAQEWPTGTDAALGALTLAALGERPKALLARLRPSPGGSIGPSVNSTIWSVLALRQARAPVPRSTMRYLLAQQTRAGGWGWTRGTVADSNDTAAAVQALRAAGVRGRPIARALAFLRRHRNRDGGFELTLGRGSDAQSTAWAIQAFLAAGAKLPPGALAYLRRMARADGSLRYSARYATTPVWVTAQALPALALRPFPLR